MSKQKPNMNRAGNMDIDAWRTKQIAKRLQTRLAENERRFAAVHARDTDEELHAFVRRLAEEMGRMPHPLELEGGAYLRQRLGDWTALSLRLGYRPPGQQQAIRAKQQLQMREEEIFTAERCAVKRRKKQLKIQRERKAAAARAYVNNRMPVSGASPGQSRAGESAE